MKRRRCKRFKICGNFLEKNRPIQAQYCFGCSSTRAEWDNRSRAWVFEHTGRKCLNCRKPVPKKRLQQHSQTCSTRCKNAYDAKQRQQGKMKQVRPEYAKMMRQHNANPGAAQRRYSHTDYPFERIR